VVCPDREKMAKEDRYIEVTALSKDEVLQLIEEEKRGIPHDSK
jgi:hypothetical protein